jgi:hypothetical protein
LRDHIQKTIDIHKHIAKVDRSIEKDEKYIQRMLKQGGGHNDSESSGMTGLGGLRGGIDDYIMEVEDTYGDIGFAASSNYLGFM